MDKNLNKLLVRLLAFFITIFCLLFLGDYLITKDDKHRIKNEITLTNSIKSSLLSTYFTVNIENSKVFNKFNLKNLDQYSFKITYTSENQKENQEIRNKILDEIKIIKNEISNDIILLINQNKDVFLLNSEIAVVSSIITSGKDFLQITEKQSIFKTYDAGYIRYIYYIFISFIISILLLLGIKLIKLNRNNINKFIKNFI